MDQSQKELNYAFNPAKHVKPWPKLMPFQELPFNGDTFVEQEFLKLRDKFGIRTIVELGTCLGSSTLWMAKHFDRVFTIEINREYRDIACDRFGVDAHRADVWSFLGDTVNILPKLFTEESEPETIREPFILFIDSHWGDNVPMLQELEIIAQTKIKPVIVIHDFKVPNQPGLGFDEYKGQAFDWEYIFEAIQKIYGGRVFSHHCNSEEKSAGAKRGVIYIYPKPKSI